MIDKIALSDLYEASIWDAFSEQTKEVIRRVDKQLDADDALAEKANTTILAMFAAQTYIWEQTSGYDNNITRVLQAAIDELDVALRKYREATDA